MAPAQVTLTRNLQQPQAQSTPRDTTQVDAALTTMAQLQDSWTTAVAETDAALAALEAAQASYDAAKVAEAEARGDLETAQSTYMTDYAAVPKEGSLP